MILGTAETAIPKIIGGQDNYPYLLIIILIFWPSPKRRLPQEALFLCSLSYSRNIVLTNHCKACQAQVYNREF